MSMITMGMGYSEALYIQPADAVTAAFDLAPPQPTNAGFDIPVQPADVTGVIYG